jgi:hypothetical protein
MQFIGTSPSLYAMGWYDPCNVFIHHYFPNSFFLLLSFIHHFSPEPHILLFRRPLGTDPQSGRVDPDLERKAREEYRALNRK